MVRFRSYRTRLQSVFLVVGLAAVGLTGWEASTNATAALQTATYERLTAIRETRARQVERYFLDLGNHVIALSSDESTILALEEFQRTWHNIPSLTNAQISELQSHYREGFLSDPRLRRRDAPELLNHWFPGEERTRALQYFFIAKNPYPPGSRFHLLTSPELGAYSEAHARFHPTLYRYLRAFGFYDIFVIGAEDGRLLYSVQKEVDLGIALSQEPYRRTTLASAWRRAMELEDPESFVIEDYAPYLPSYFAPAAFVAAPIHRAGIKVGVLAIQLSIQEINRMMTAGGAWRQEGFGETGQVYLVGNDGTLRSDLRDELEQPNDFYRKLEEAGTPRSLIERIRSYGTAVLNLNVLPAGISKQYTGPATNFLEQPVLRSQAPLELPSLSWTVVAEISRGEALAAVRHLRWRIFWQALVLAAMLFVVARLLAGGITKNLVRLTAGAQRLGKRDFGVHLPVESEDEIGQLAASFNRMAEDLQHTTVSKEELDRMLSSLINGVIVLDAGRDAAPDALLQSPVRQINPAGLDLLGYSQREVDGLFFEQLLDLQDAADWLRRMERLLQEGQLPASEAALRATSGDRVPVLFAASWLTPEHGKPPGIVCVAQDISEWKETQARLREKQAELEKLTTRLIDAQEEERARLARELHDDLTQRLAAVAIEAGQLERIPTDQEDRRRSMQRRIKAQLAEIANDVHGLSRRLHPSTLDDLGLPAAIEAECRAFFERGGAPVEFKFESVPPLTDETQLALYRIVQEALHNIAKHAEADEVRIQLSADAHVVQLEILDNGRGFERSAPDWRPGIGLVGMEERVRPLGGSCIVQSSPGRGTRIKVEVPIGHRYAQTESSAG